MAKLRIQIPYRLQEAIKLISKALNVPLALPANVEMDDPYDPGFRELSAMRVKLYFSGTSDEGRELYGYSMDQGVKIVAVFLIPNYSLPVELAQLEITSVKQEYLMRLGDVPHTSEPTKTGKARLTFTTGQIPALLAHWERQRSA